MLNALKKHWVIVLSIILILLLVSKNEKLRSQNEELIAQNEDLQTEVDDYQSSLTEANNNIDDANSMIEDAQNYAWSSYGDMGEALDNLAEIDNVNDPQ